MADGFMYNGAHSDALGTVFVVAQWPVAPPPMVNKMGVAGRHGTLRYKGTYWQERTLSGSLYLLSETGEPLSYTEMMGRVPEIAHWLCPGGRRELILDAQPDRFYMAEIEQALSVETAEWSNGHIPVTFTLQPFAYSRIGREIAGGLAANASYDWLFHLDGSQPAPLGMTVTADAALTWLEIRIQGKRLCLEDMTLGAGQAASVSYDLTTGELMAVTVNGEPGMRHLTADSAMPLMLAPGLNAMVVSADAQCALQVLARGRWL